MAKKLSLHELYLESKKIGGFPPVLSRPPTAPHRIHGTHVNFLTPPNTSFPPISSSAPLPPHRTPNLPSKS